MNDVNLPDEDLQNASPEEIMSALFANMIIQQTNMALMLLGKVPHPETGEIYKDLESAKMFIDQLEMIEAKTKGNLDKREEGLLKQSLAALRMAFVEEIDAQGASDPSVVPSIAAGPHNKENPDPIAPAPQAAPVPRVSELASQPSAPPEDSESRKKFSKKY
jgi:hypothetical protein